MGGSSAREARHLNKKGGSLQSRPPSHLTPLSGAELLVSAAISSHATSHTLRRQRLSSRVNGGSNKKKARGSPGELAPATASPTALRCIYL